MKKITTLLFICTILLSLTACGNETPKVDIPIIEDEETANEILTSEEWRIAAEKFLSEYLSLLTLHICDDCSHERNYWFSGEWGNADYTITYYLYDLEDNGIPMILITRNSWGSEMSSLYKLIDKKYIEICSFATGVIFYTDTKDNLIADSSNGNDGIFRLFRINIIDNVTLEIIAENEECFEYLANEPLIKINSLSSLEKEITKALR